MVPRPPNHPLCSWKVFPKFCCQQISAVLCLNKIYPGSFVACWGCLNPKYMRHACLWWPCWSALGCLWSCRWGPASETSNINQGGSWDLPLGGGRVHSWGSRGVMLARSVSPGTESEEWRYIRKKNGNVKSIRGCWLVGGFLLFFF